MRKITKAVIPAAGLGTRFLPATKALPKEMLPIVDKPAIQYIVEEAIKSGIDSIIIVTGRNKKAIEDHFDKSVELEQVLESKGKYDLLREVQSIGGKAVIHYIRQKEPLGLGHAVRCARQFIGDEPFAVLLGDDIMNSSTPAIRQMMNVYEATGKQVVGVRTVEEQDVSKYGIIDSIHQNGLIHEVGGLVEKPSPADAPSRQAVIGRYVLEPSIFSILENMSTGAGGEYQLTDALHQVALQSQLLALELEGTRYDIGDKAGYLEAVLHMGMQREDLRPMLDSMMREWALASMIK
ncbi:UTP--glucose-1-phosphate uridylyltransferase GalU [Paenibacillus sp. CMAA1739]|uniref:UTP--glucose-1-phosphate uridylyltransferase GalU n=1 Tax=Paenibacillus ottowii TaxID=2315729 RepID=UPI0027313FCE|nr:MULTISPECIES: UTP--glucose-1-phosphate uridylyltransferase GalU [Paenibacillus]MDP1512280.1 UTP--glucose-1-phosphate uridylyltransferase GalU [Paenibacillus ottowii]MEC4567615.1 UTP--glucose-1-phosphate uridylyltransferase GalU [Paenibacillus sp. CMAA1739]